MVTVNKDTLQAYKQLYNGSDPHDPRVPYPPNTHVRDGSGNIYVSIQSVPGSNVADDQIPLTDTEYWYQAAGSLGSTIDLDAILTPNAAVNGSIVAYNSTSGDMESFAIPTSNEYYIDSDGERSSRAATQLDPNLLGFKDLPSPSRFNKTSYVAYSDSSYRAEPSPWNIPMDLAVDMQGYLVSAYGISNSAAILLINPWYYRMTMAGNFEQCIANRDARVSRITSFAGRYAILLDNGNFYSRTVAQAYPQQMYSATWFGQDAMDLDTVIGGTAYTVLNFEQSANCYVLLYQNTNDNSYHLLSFRFHLDGTTVTTLRDVALTGTAEPTQFGFLEYPQVPTDTLDPEIFAVQDGMLRYTTSGSTLSTSVVCNRVYPYTHEKFYISASTSATFLTTFVNDVYDSSDSGIGIPNTSTSFRDGTENGFVAVFNETIYVEGTNADGELGTGDSAAQTTGATVTIFDSTQVPARQLKDCMVCHLGSCRAFIIWSEQEAFMCGLGRGTREQLGRFMHDESDGGYGTEYVFQSNTFRRVFNTNNIIKDAYVHNQDPTHPYEQILIFLLQNGTAYGKGTTLITGDVITPLSPYFARQGTATPDTPAGYLATSKIVDYYNVSYRRLGI